MQLRERLILFNSPRKKSGLDHKGGGSPKSRQSRKKRVLFFTLFNGEVQKSQGNFWPNITERTEK